MRAKEYARQYFCNPSDRNMAEICATMMIDEVKQLVISRNAQTDSALIAIFKEQDNKWRAFCRLIAQEHLSNVFVKMVTNEFPYIPLKER